MKKYFFLFIVFLPSFFLQGEENWAFQAEALWEARDYAAASKIYEKLLSQSPPPWQQARILYNLGTLQLAQQQPVEALTFFQKISPMDLSLPRFGRDLFLNEGIAYLQYAYTLSNLDEQVIFIEQGLKAFDQAQQLDCQIQKEEEEASCHSSPLLDQWMKFAHLQLNHLYQQKQQQLASLNLQDNKDAKTTPAAILQRAIHQANRALQLLVLAQTTTKDSSIQREPILKSQQDTLMQSASFIPSVLKEQERRFHQANNSDASCQQSPWDQVIPLFDKGYRAAQQAEQQLKQNTFNAQEIFAFQEQTIKNWQQALNLILHPPPQNATSTPEKLTETFRLIQEMYLEDQSSPEQKSEVLHSW